MSGLFATLNTAKSGMMTQQGAISTTSHNLSNVNTPGYSRQTVTIKANLPHSNPAFNTSISSGQVGTGSSIVSINRVRNTFYDYQFRSQAHKYGESSTSLEYAKEIENVFNEPSETGLSSTMNDFFNSWHELSKNPSNLSAKNIVVQQTNKLTNQLQTTYSSLQSLKENVNLDIQNNLTEINNNIEQLQILNHKIMVIEASGKNANDLCDQRDLILDQLSYKFDIKENEALLKKDEITLNDLEQIMQNGGNLSGELQGLFNSLESINSYQNELNTITNTIATEVNNLLNPVLGFDFFVSKNGNPLDASNIVINEDIKSNTDLLNLGTNGSSIALELSELGSKNLTIGNKGNITINNYYSHIIENLGFDTKEIQQNLSNFTSTLTSIDQSRLSETGVSIDEEFANLIQFQRAYQASSKVISIVDELLDVVINGLIR